MNIPVGLDSAKPFADTAQFNIHGSIFITDGSHKKTVAPAQAEATGIYLNQPPTLIDPAMMPARIASTSAFSAAGTALSKL